MKKFIKLLCLLLSTILLISAVGCAQYDFAEEGNYIVTAKEALEMVENGAILIDAQSTDQYAVEHVKGAVNIPMSALTISEPFPNMLPNKGQIEKVMGEAGISEADTILVYDDENNMAAARVQWTLEIYGNTNVKVVSGGIKALKAEKAEITSEATALSSTTYKTQGLNKKMLAKLNYVQSQLNMPEEDVIIIDTRSTEEFNEGTIPGSVHIEYINNNYATGEYKSFRDLQITYLDKGIYPDDKIILFCKTSVRAAQTYTALRDAGYKNIRIYDGAWLEYSAGDNPTDSPDDKPAPTQQDGS